MSQRDLPLWARGVAAGLLVFASWWLLSTDALRNTLGDSIGILCLGVISVFILRGMHLPLSIWPFGPWRKSFQVVAVITVAVAIAGLILLSGMNQPSVLADIIDPGMAVLVVAGALFWGFGYGFVKQRSFLPWHLIALITAILPLLVNLLLSIGGEGSGDALCVWTRQGAAVENATLCHAAMLPTLMFLVAVGATSALVTEELAFRRLLIGQPKKAGLLVVLAAAVIAAAWYAVLGLMDVGFPAPLVLGSVGALNAGCIYVLSQSLLVSALYSGAFMASYWALTLSSLDPGAQVGPQVPFSIWLTALVIGIGLAAIVAKQNGILGDLMRHEEPLEQPDASGD